jgi:hypothetical protein
VRITTSQVAASYLMPSVLAVLQQVLRLARRALALQVGRVRGGDDRQIGQLARHQ